MNDTFFQPTNDELWGIISGTLYRITVQGTRDFAHTHQFKGLKVLA
jgi:hypothetical protein